MPVPLPSDDDIVVVCALRTPVTRAKKGLLRDTPPDSLLASVLEPIFSRLPRGVAVDDIVVGNVLAQKSGIFARLGASYAGVPHSVSVSQVNRQCASGLQAIVTAAGMIARGDVAVAVAAGVESMSSGDMMAAAEDLNPRAFECPAARDCLVPMGITSENVAAKFGVTREEQDAFSATSHAKAAIAQEQGLFRDEIVPVRTSVVDEASGERREVEVTADDGVRKGTTPESLAKLKPAFQKDGSTTAGNASQVSDGAAAVLLMKRSRAKALNLPILGRLVSSAVVGCDPLIMGVGPAYAIPPALSKAGVSISQVDVFEINEAFASQAVYCANKLGIEPRKINPLGGAIALGHPLGATGVRHVATLLHHMKRNNLQIGVSSMCIGTGMGMAAVWARE